MKTEIIVNNRTYDVVSGKDVLKSLINAMFGEVNLDVLSTETIATWIMDCCKMALENSETNKPSKSMIYGANISVAGNRPDMIAYIWNNFI